MFWLIALAAVVLGLWFLAYCFCRAAGQDESMDEPQGIE